MVRTLAARAVRAYPVPTKKKSVDICQAFITGVPSEHGHTGDVFYGVTEANAVAWQTVKTDRKTRPYYYIDNSYFDATRGAYYRVTKNAIQFQGPDYASDGKRWDALGYTLKPWRDPDQGHVILCPQSETYMRYTVGKRKLARLWLAQVIDMVESAWPKREIRVRAWAAEKQMASLHDDLVGAGLLVTHSSAAAVEAVIEGVQVILDAGSPSALATLPPVIDNADDQRLKYLRALADNQWTLDEIKRGDAWRWINR